MLAAAFPGLELAGVAWIRPGNPAGINVWKNRMGEIPDWIRGRPCVLPGRTLLAAVPSRTGSHGIPLGPAAAWLASQVSRSISRGMGMPSRIVPKQNSMKVTPRPISLSL